MAEINPVHLEYGSRISYSRFEFKVVAYKRYSHNPFTQVLPVQRSYGKLWLFSLNVVTKVSKDKFTPVALTYLH